MKQPGFLGIVLSVAALCCEASVLLAAVWGNIMEDDDVSVILLFCLVCAGVSLLISVLATLHFALFERKMFYMSTIASFLAFKLILSGVIIALFSVAAHLAPANEDLYITAVVVYVVPTFIALGFNYVGHSKETTRD
jgi:hypothetical protein